MNYADDKVKQILFQQSRGANSKINDPFWSSFEFIPDFIHVHLYLQVSGKSDQNLMSYVDDNVEQRLFQQLRECNAE